MDGAVFLPVGCFAWGNPALAPTSCLVGLMAASRRAHTNEYFPALLLPVSSSLQWAKLPPTSAGDPPILAGRFGPVSYGVTAFMHWVLVHTRLCVCPPRVEFLSSPVLWKYCSQTHWPSKQVLWRLLLPLPDPQAGQPDVGPRTFTPMGNLLWYSCFPVFGSCNGYGIWFYCNCTTPTISLWLLDCLWM